VINTGADNHQAWTSLQLQSFDGKSWFGLESSSTPLRTDAASWE
jgi:hypothetical protein